MKKLLWEISVLLAQVRRNTLSLIPVTDRNIQLIANKNEKRERRMSPWGKLGKVPLVRIKKNKQGEFMKRTQQINL